VRLLLALDLSTHTLELLPGAAKSALGYGDSPPAITQVVVQVDPGHASPTAARNPGQ
jgi:hypothetical protein